MEHTREGVAAEGIARRVTAQIRESGVTLVWLCGRTGIPRSTMNRRMVNPADFTVNELERIAAALRIDLADLVREQAVA